jgi:hypothetical protein
LRGRTEPEFNAYSLRNKSSPRQGTGEKEKAMTRYFFDVENDDTLHIDDEGTELSGAREAGVEAIQALAELALDRLPGTESKHLKMIVRDAEGNRSFELDLMFKIHLM